MQTLISILMFSLVTTLMAQPPLHLDLRENNITSENLAFSLGDGDGLFVLARESASLLRINPSSGQVMWRIDGSEAGEAFIDPAWISRTDGFFVYLTDRGTRKVWRVDYRGELRGAVNLPFAADPLMLELAAGGQMVLYDRASALIHLLDDSGRSLWSFPPGEGRTSAEPSAITLGPHGQRLFFIWHEQPRLTSVNLFGSSSRRVTVDTALPDTPLALAAAGSNEISVLALIGPGGAIYRLDAWSGNVTKMDTGIEKPLDIRGDISGFSVLSGDGPAVYRIELEGGGR